MHGLSEKELIKLCLSNDRKAQQQLFDRFSSKMLTVCRRYAGKMIQAEDLLQEGFIRVYKNLHQFNFQGSLEGWIRRIMVHSCIKYVTKKINKTEFVELSNEASISVKAEAFSNLSAEDLMQLISQLPIGYRTVFNLYAIEGYSHAEIADLLNIKTSTSRSQLVKARKMLQVNLIKLQKLVG